ncbi:MAG: leucine-rich repeat protein [Bacilli bacterium]
MKKGFTLTELLAVFILLGIIALIAVPVMGTIKEEFKKSTFKESAKGILKAGQTFYAENDYENFPVEGLEVSNQKLKIKNRKQYNSGVLLYNTANGQFELQLLSNGLYCANGTLDDLNISKGNCETKDSCFTFTPSTGTIEKYDYQTCSSHVVIPEKINGVNVKNIASNAFVSDGFEYYCSSDKFLTKTVKPSTYIKQPNEICLIKNAVEGIVSNNSLKSLMLPSTLETIGDNAFAGSSIKLLNLGKNNSLREIKEGAFVGNKNLKTVSISTNNNLSIIGSYSFFNTPLKEFNFKSLTSLSVIDTGAFNGTSLINVDLSNALNLTSIGEDAFFGITSTGTELQLGDKSKVTNVGKKAFCNGPFIYQGWTNIDKYITPLQFTESCLETITSIA